VGLGINGHLVLPIGMFCGAACASVVWACMPQNISIDRYIKLIGFNELRGALLLFIARIDQPMRDTYEQRTAHINSAHEQYLIFYDVTGAKIFFYKLEYLIFMKNIFFIKYIYGRGFYNNGGSCAYRTNRWMRVPCMDLLAVDNDGDGTSTDGAWRGRQTTSCMGASRLCDDARR
jgi:hypothetical protein